MRRVFGLVGYACNGKTTVMQNIIDSSSFTYIDLPSIYKMEASKRGFSGVTEFYVSVGLEKYRKIMLKAVFDYIDRNLPRDADLIIDDIFDIQIYNRLISIFPQMKLIGFHSRKRDRLARLSVRAGITDELDLINGLIKRDNMKKYCGIEEVFIHCKYHITNNKDIEHVKNELLNDLNKSLIINIVGYSGSGKSSVCNYLSQSLKIPIFQYGKEVTKIVNDLGYKKSREYVNKNGIDDYLNTTNEKMAEVLKKYCENNKFFIIDGIVSSTIYDNLLNENEVYSVYIRVCDEQRLKRISGRENIDVSDEAIIELNTKDDIKIENGLDIIVSKCDAVINGEHSLDVIINDIQVLLERELCKK